MEFGFDGVVTAVAIVATVIITIAATKARMEERFKRGESHFDRIDERMNKGDMQHEEIRADLKEISTFMHQEFKQVRAGQADLSNRITRVETKIDNGHGK